MLKHAQPAVSPLEHHVARFIEHRPDGRVLSPETVKKGLQELKCPLPATVAHKLAAFYSLHSGAQCPFADTLFKASPEGHYEPYLHLGTTRIWNPDGSINEDRWKQFEDFVSRGQKPDNVIITLSQMKDYLDHCAKNDREDPSTGRCIHSFWSGAYQQIKATKDAWDALFHILACGWKDNDLLGDVEPIMSLSLIRLFFENSNEAFLKAERGELPVPKPTKATAASPTSPSYQIFSPSPLYT